MTYSLTALDQADKGKTVVMLKVAVFSEIASIPWNGTERITISLHPDNIELLGDVAADADVKPKPTMPVLTQTELNEIVGVILKNGKAIQSQNRRPFGVL